MVCFTLLILDLDVACLVGGTGIYYVICIMILLSAAQKPWLQQENQVGAPRPAPARPWITFLLPPAGSNKYKKVRQANRMARRLAYLCPSGTYTVLLAIVWLCLLQILLRCEYARGRDVDWVIENPSSSLLWQYSAIRVSSQQLHLSMQPLQSCSVTHALWGLLPRLSSGATVRRPWQCPWAPTMDQRSRRLVSEASGSMWM